MKYVYVVSEIERWVTIIDLTNKSVMNLCQYDEGDFDYGKVATWNESDNRDFLEYSSIEDIMQSIDFRRDIIFASDLTIADMCSRLDNPSYNDWNSNWNSCFEVLRQTDRSYSEICLQELVTQMQR